MITKLPLDFKNKMKNLLGDEYEEFIKAYEYENKQSFRLNLLKGTKEIFLKKHTFTTSPIPWIDEGFYYSKDDFPGKHPFHHAGVYYIQEPSAMTVVSLLNIKPKDRVLDLCAAPGGKTTFAASKLENQGVLVSNEIVQKRSRILLHNVERMGIKNSMITNEDSHKLSKYFPEFFTKIIVDAPCSGEGMFRKDPNCCDEWSTNNVLKCAERQNEILENAYKMLSPGGQLIYSTCTFSPEENEMAIDKFISKFPDMKIIELPLLEGFSQGRPEWTNSQNPDLKNTIRLWPHINKGEGHYIALLEKDGMPKDIKPTSNKTNLDKKQMEEFNKFFKETLNISIDDLLEDGILKIFGESLYLTPYQLNTIELKGLNILRNGLHLGDFKKNRFEPSHHLALALKKDQVKYSHNLNSSNVKKYLLGETLDVEDSFNGWTLILIDGYSLGWGKSKNGLCKNHYPKGLRVNK